MLLAGSPRPAAIGPSARSGSPLESLQPTFWSGTFPGPSRCWRWILAVVVLTGCRSTAPTTAVARSQRASPPSRPTSGELPAAPPRRTDAALAPRGEMARSSRVVRRRDERASPPRSARTPSAPFVSSGRSRASHAGSVVAERRQPGRRFSTDLPEQRRACTNTTNPRDDDAAE